MDARRWAWALLSVLLLAGCAPRPNPTVRVALLAPFEGRYREVGYNALYAARLALQDNNNLQVELLPLDDGGSGSAAAERARGLVEDAQVHAVVALGYAATEPIALGAFGELPVLVVGGWGAAPAGSSTFILASPSQFETLSVDPRVEILDAAELAGPLVGGEVFALEQLPRLRTDLDGITVLSSAALPDADFADRYRALGEFTPAPGLLASLTYDAVRLAADAAESNATRAAAAESLRTVQYQGLNGPIAFQNGYWTNAPLNRYHYANGLLLRADDIVE